jgi:hypothetical protein
LLGRLLDREGVAEGVQPGDCYPQQEPTDDQGEAKLGKGDAATHGARIAATGGQLGIRFPPSAAGKCVPLPPGGRRAILALPLNHQTQGPTLFTRAKLFGECGSSGDVLSHAAFLDRARLEREHDRDGAARSALTGYVVARLVDRRLAGDHQGEGRESFLWQLEAVQRHLRGLPADAPETAHLAGIVESLPLDGGQLSGLRVSLTAYAYFLEHDGRLEEGLETLELAARTHGELIPPDDFAALALFAGRLNRLMARWDVATGCYQAADAAALSVGNTASALRSRLGRTAVLWGQGNLPLARATVEAVIRDASDAGLQEVEAMAYADLGSVLTNQGLRIEAVTANYRAFILAEDTLLRMRVLGDLGVGLLELGAYEAARLAFELVVDSPAGFVVRTNALVELLQLESAVGNRVAFERRRAEAAETRDRMPPSMAADFHFKSGVGLARFGQIHRARELLEAGLRLAEEHQLNTWYFRFERVLENLGSRETREPVPVHAEELSGSPAIQEVTVGLREYASISD